MKHSTSVATGFTLFEILVVIAILGIIAAAVLVAINPGERIKEAHDSNHEQDATNLVDAVETYYVTHTAMPWDPISNGGGNCNLGNPPNDENINPGGNQLPYTPFYSCIATLYYAGETRFFPAAFICSPTPTVVAGITIVPCGYSSDGMDYYPDFHATYSNGTFSVCFAPQSKSMSLNSDTKYNSDDTSGCTNTIQQCYWCSHA